MNVHAIGDRANGVVLDAFEDALLELGCLDGIDTVHESDESQSRLSEQEKRERRRKMRRKEGDGCAEVRPRLEHAQMLTNEDVERVGRLGVIASVQPAHVYVYLRRCSLAHPPKAIDLQYQ